MEVGLREPGRRRTPGLRREDVAALAGVSVTWYTMLEQGRSINMSAAILERICSTLQLSCDEREYLFSLVQGRPAPQLSERDEQLNETLSHMIQYLPVPALVMTLRWDIVAWNYLIMKIFRDYAKVDPASRNLLRIILTDEKYHKEPEEFDSLARNLLSKFRVDFSQCAGDPAFEELIGELRAGVPRFQQLWEAAEIRSSMRGTHLIRHPELGDLYFEQSSYVPEGSSFLRLLIFVPCDEKTDATLAALNAEAAATGASRTRHYTLAGSGPKRARPKAGLELWKIPRRGRGNGRSD
jgi:transcriptional regulator with XRE-family HTH domain